MESVDSRHLKRGLCLYSVGWKFPVQIKASSALHISLAADLERIQTDSLIPHQLKVFRNLRTGYFLFSTGESTNPSGPDLTSDPLCSGSQHRTVSTGDQVLRPNRGRWYTAFQQGLGSPLPVGPKCWLAKNYILDLEVKMNRNASRLFSIRPSAYSHIYILHIILAYISFHLFLLCPVFVLVLFSSQEVFFMSLTTLFTFLWNIKILLNPTHFIEHSVRPINTIEIPLPSHVIVSELLCVLSVMSSSPGYRWRQEAEALNRTHPDPTTSTAILALASAVQKSFRIVTFQ